MPRGSFLFTLAFTPRKYDFARETESKACHVCLPTPKLYFYTGIYACIQMINSRFLRNIWHRLTPLLRLETLMPDSHRDQNWSRSRKSQDIPSPHSLGSVRIAAFPTNKKVHFHKNHFSTDAVARTIYYFSFTCSGFPADSNTLPN